MKKILIRGRGEGSIRLTNYMGWDEAISCGNGWHNEDNPGFFHRVIRCIGFWIANWLNNLFIKKTYEE